jgi:hypothetical protein
MLKDFIYLYTYMLGCASSLRVQHRECKVVPTEQRFSKSVLALIRFETISTMIFVWIYIGLVFETRLTSSNELRN